MQKTEIVQEFTLTDGIGAQLWRKIYAMSYAKEYGLIFKDTKINNFHIHESDNIKSEEEKKELIEKFYSILDIQKLEEDFENLLDYSICKKVGLGLPESQGIIFNDKKFLRQAVNFSKVLDTDNSIVIHIRRGDVIKENPRWIEEDVYVSIIKNINKVIALFNLKNPEVIILTDAPDEERLYKPINQEQANLWNQIYLYANNNGEYVSTSFNFDKLREHYPSLKVVNKLNTFDSFLLMLRAKILFVSRSAFSQSAGLLSKNNVFEMFDSYNGFCNSVGSVTSSGDIIFYNKKP
jgi:hypothetical protein